MVPAGRGVAGQDTVTASPAAAAVDEVTVTGDPPVVDTVTVRVSDDPARGVAVTVSRPGVGTLRVSVAVGRGEPSQRSVVPPRGPAGALAGLVA